MSHIFWDRLKYYCISDSLHWRWSQSVQLRCQLVWWWKQKQSYLTLANETNETKEPYKLSTNAMRLRCNGVLFLFYSFGFVCLSTRQKHHSLFESTLVFIIFFHLHLHTLPQTQRKKQRTNWNKQCQEAYFTHLLLFALFFFYVQFLLFSLAMTHKIVTILL